MGDLISCIGSLVKDYEQNLSNDTNSCPTNSRLLKTKNVIKEYPMLTQYSIAKAVQDKKLNYTKIGNTNYFKVEDIENFINSGNKESGDSNG